MEIATIIALVIAGLTFIWTLYRDKSGDTEQLMGRVGHIETKVLLTESNISRLEAEQDEMKKTLKSLEAQINQMNLKVERILTILEKE
ncbi:hypothetical protein [Pseudescherichia vulneris]|uniref:hypothetical protein n=1 Tax=Pseudescherichia vulneris TaxID=566 RepID=UPI0028B20507|nr:hypothetical protein [Pseudescherichia vulneris]